MGDFDSVNDEEREILKTLNIHPVKAEKDDTDLALGVEQAIQKGYTEIDIYGATGGRWIILWEHYKFFSSQTI